MKLNILLINPWIYDFAAYNLWSRPLGLLKVAEYLSSFDTGLSLIDCTDSFALKHYGSGRFRSEVVEKREGLKGIPRLYKRYGISLDECVKRLQNSQPADLVLVTSLMSYWYPGVQKTMEIIREVMGDVPVILGGNYATLYPEHASRHSGADFIFRGPLGRGLNIAFSTFNFRLRKKGEEVPYYRLNLYNQYPFAPLFTSSGCPFQCSYCASRLLAPPYERSSPDAVLRDVKEFYQRGTRDYVFYDDALLVEPDTFIKPFLAGIVREGLPVRFHTPNGLHARFVDDELSRLMKASNFKTIRLGLETSDERRQHSTGAKVDNEAVAEAVRLLKKQGFTKRELGVYLMYGLPGQPWEEVLEGINFLKSLDVRIYLNEFSPIRGTEAWSELVSEGIFNDSLDPLFTNNTVFPYLYSGYDREEVQHKKLEVKEYNSKTS